MNQIILIGIMMFLVISCTSANTNEPNNPKSIEIPSNSDDLHDIWVVQEIEGQVVKADIYPHGLPTLEISITDSRINGFSGCNQYFGNVTVGANNTINFDQIGATKMFCEGVPESQYFNLLNSITAYEREGLLLHFYNGSEKVATFKKVD